MAQHPVQAAHHRAEEAAQRWTIFGGTQGKVACTVALVGIGLVVANRFLSHPVLDAVAKPLASPRTGGLFLLALGAIWGSGVRTQRREVREAKREVETANQLLRGRTEQIARHYSVNQLVAMVAANEIPDDCPIESLSVEEVRAWIGEELVEEYVCDLHRYIYFDRYVPSDRSELGDPLLVKAAEAFRGQCPDQQGLDARMPKVFERLCKRFPTDATNESEVVPWKIGVRTTLDHHASDCWFEKLGQESNLRLLSKGEVLYYLATYVPGEIRVSFGTIMVWLGWRGQREDTSRDVCVKSYFFASEAIRLAGSEKRVREIFAAGDDQPLHELAPIVDSFRDLTLEQPTVGGLKAALPQVTRALKLDSIS